MYTTKNISSCFMLCMIGSFFILGSCQSDSHGSLVKGRYLIVEAERNGRMTTTLENGYFDILTDTTMKTNIFGNEEVVPLMIEQSKLHQKGSMPVTYVVRQLAGDTLEWAATIQSNKFLFYLIPDSLVSSNVVEENM